MAEWRTVPGFPDYVACEDGRVARVVGHKGANGYLQVELPGRLEGKGHSLGSRPAGRHKSRVYVHHIIAVTFLGAPPDGKDQANHKDGDRTNNVVTNLEWCNQSENIKHGWSMRKNRSFKKMSEDEVKTVMVLRAQGCSYADIGLALGRHQTAIAYRVRQMEAANG